MSSPTILQISGSTWLSNIILPFLVGNVMLLYIVNKKVFISAHFFIVLISFALLIVFSVSLNPAYSLFSEIKYTVIYYFGVIIMMLIVFLRPVLYFGNGSNFFQGFIIFSLFESILGIFQFILKVTVVPVTFHGEQIVSSIYYIPGQGGTGDSSLLTSGYFIRAFGTMGSGLGLGILMICSLAILQTWKNTKNLLFLKVLFIITALFTLTGTVLIGLLMYILFFNFAKSKNNAHKVLIIFYSLWSFGLSSQIIFASLPQSFFEIAPTLSSRFDGIRYYYSVLRFNFSNLIFGQNFTNRWAELANATINPNGRYVVDNFYMYIFYDLGLLGIFLIFITQKKILSKLIFDRNEALIALNLSILVMGFANNISYAIAICTIISTLMIKQGSERESKI